MRSISDSIIDEHGQPNFPIRRLADIDWKIKSPLEKQIHSFFCAVDPSPTTSIHHRHRWGKMNSLRIFICLIAIVASHAQLVAQSVTLPADVLDTSDVDYTSVVPDVGGGYTGISDATSLGAGGGGDHFDGAFAVGVNGLPYGVGGGTLNGSELQLDSATLGLFDIDVQFRAQGPLLRQFVTVTNNGAASVAAVSWHNNTGNDAAQRVVATSSGDLGVTTLDQWLVTADSNTTDAEVNSWILYSQGSLAPSSVSLNDELTDFGGVGEEGFSATFNVPLQPGESASLIWFVGIEGVVDDGIGLAEQFDDLSSPFFNSLIDDLSTEERARVVNFNLAAVPEPGAGAILLLGTFVVARRRFRPTLASA